MIFHDFTVTLGGDRASRREHDTADIEPRAVEVFAQMIRRDRAFERRPVPVAGFGRITLTWIDEGHGAATATFYSGGVILSHSALASGRDAEADRRHLGGLQGIVVRALRGTPLEPGFDALTVCTDRPALVTLVFPPAHPDHPLVADMETCLMAAWMVQVASAEERTDQ